VSDVYQRGQKYYGGISNRIRSLLKTCPHRVFVCPFIRAMHRSISPTKVVMSRWSDVIIDLTRRCTPPPVTRIRSTPVPLFDIDSAKHFHHNRR